MIEEANGIIAYKAQELLAAEICFCLNIKPQSIKAAIYDCWADLLVDAAIAVKLMKQQSLIALILQNWNLVSARIYIQGRNCKFFEINPQVTTGINMNTESPLVIDSSIFTGEMNISLPIYRVFGYFLENSATKGGIVRVHDERQLAMSNASAAIFKSPELMQEACKKRRHEYWNLEDLETFRQFTRQELSLSTTQNPFDLPGREFTYRAKIGDFSGETWARFTTRYRIFQDPFNITYQASEIINVEPIAI